MTKLSLVKGLKGNNRKRRSRSTYLTDTTISFAGKHSGPKGSSQYRRMGERKKEELGKVRDTVIKSQMEQPAKFPGMCMDSQKQPPRKPYVDLAFQQREEKTRDVDLRRHSHYHEEVD